MLRISGLNAPIYERGAFILAWLNRHEHNHMFYGDVFYSVKDERHGDEPVDSKNLWGELEHEEDGEKESDEEDEEEPTEAAPADGSRMSRNTVWHGTHRLTVTAGLKMTDFLELLATPTASALACNSILCSLRNRRASVVLWALSVKTTSAVWSVLPYQGGVEAR